MIGEVVYIDGRFVPRDEARVSVFDHGFVYGDAVFEGLQAVNGRIFRLDAHLDRLYRSARYLGIEIGITREALGGVIVETARRNGLRDGYLRPLVSRGAGPVGLRNMDRLGPPTIVVMVQHEEGGRQRALERGLSAHVVSFRRIPSECLDARVKSCNYLNSILAYLEAKHAGADTAILLDIHGHVAEAQAGNIFAVQRGVVLTPPLGHILEGVTRTVVIELCQASDIPVREAPLTVYDLLTADEVFETATLSELTPIVSIDGRAVGDGKVGACSRTLHQALRRLMESGEQSTPVDA